MNGIENQKGEGKMYLDKDLKKRFYAVAQTLHESNGDSIEMLSEDGISKFLVTSSLEGLLPLGEVRIGEVVYYLGGVA